MKKEFTAKTVEEAKALAAAEFGVAAEEITFEIIEECSRGELDEREDFWQEYFHALDFGFSIK